MKAKLIAMILGTVMVFSMVGCGSQEAESEVPDNATEAVETEDEDAGEAMATTINTEGTFVDTRSGKTEYDSFDDVIGQLEPGEAYAYVTIAGHDRQVLAVTDGTFAWDDSTNAAIDVDFYAEVGYIDNKIMNIGSVSTGATSYPVRCSADGILYACNNDIYGELKITDTDLLFYAKKIAITYDTKGNYTLEGFTTEDGSMANSSKDIGVATEEEFFALYDVLDEVPVVNFQVVE